MLVYDKNMMLSDGSLPVVKAYLEQRGYDPARLAIMTGVALINAYHKEGWTQTPIPSDVQRATSQAVLDTLLAMPERARPSPDDEMLIRYLARDEASKVIAEMKPQRLEIVTATGSTIVDGPIHYRTPLVIETASLGHHVMMIGPAGCGKTTIGEHVATALNLPFYITSTVSESHELTGYMDGYGQYHSTPFRRAYESGGVWIADEIDAWEANALLTANSALANGFCNFPDVETPIFRHPDFRMIATANTFGSGADRVYVGRNELDAASLDRFATITVDYDLDLERLFANGADAWLEHVWNVRRKVNEKKIRHVVSSRAIIFGSQALSVGRDWSVCEDLYLFKGMSKKDRDKIDDR